jgi:hypothetical protein
MDDTAYCEFFQQPTQTYHRRYEALRAVFVDQRCQKEVARAFGFTYDSMRQLVGEFRRYCDADRNTQDPFFETSLSDAPPALTTKSSNRPLPIAEN